MSLLLLLGAQIPPVRVGRPLSGAVEPVHVTGAAESAIHETGGTEVNV